MNDDYYGLAASVGIQVNGSDGATLTDNDIVADWNIPVRP